MFYLLVLTLCGLASLASGSTFSPARPPAIPLAGMSLVGKSLSSHLTNYSQVAVYEHLARSWQ